MGNASFRSAATMLLAAVLSPVDAPATQLSTARILVHLSPTAAKNPCTLPELSGCALATTQGDLGVPYYAYVLVARFGGYPGLSGAQFGIQYNGAAGAGVDVFDWVPCAALEFGDDDWPASGTGTQITWDRV